MARPIRTVVIIDADGKPATVEIGKLQRATADLDTSVDKASEGFGKMGDAAGNIPGPVGDIAGALSGPGGVVAGVGAAVTGLFAMAQSFATTAIEAETLAVATESSVEESSQLLAAVKRFGLEYNDVTDIALQVTGALEGNVELMGKLGVTAKQAENPMQNLKAAIDSWDFLTATERAQSFGEEGVRQIAAIIASGESLDELLDDVGDAVILSPEDVERARQLQETTAELAEIWDGIVISVGGFVARDIQDLKDNVERVTNATNLFGDSIADTILKSREMAAAQREAAELSRWDALAAKYGEVGEAGVEAFDDTTAAYDTLIGKVDDRKAYRSLEDAFTKLREKGVAVWEANAKGGEESAEAAREYEKQLDEVIIAVGKWGTEIAGLPTEVLVDFTAQIEAGNIAFVEGQLAGLARRRTAQIVGQFLQVGPGGTGLGSGSFTGSGGTGPRSNNMTVNLSRSSSPREVDAAIARWKRNNG